MSHSLVIHIKKPIMQYVDYLLVYIFFVLTLYIFLFNYSSIIFDIRYVFAIIAAARGYYVSLQKKFWPPFLIAGLFIFCYLICVICQQSLNLSFNNFIYTIIYIGLAILLLKGSFGYRVSGILFLVCAGIVFFRYVVGYSVDNILTANSRNYISVLLLFVLLLYYLAIHRCGQEGLVYIFGPAIIFFLLSVLAYGRGGILASAFLLFALGIFKSFDVQSSWQRRSLRVLAFIAILLVILYFVFENQLTFLLGKFNISFTDEVRLSYWGDFFANNVNSVGDFLFGSDLSLIRSDQNIHNSFLQCYGSYGLIAFIFLIVMSIRSIIESIRHKDYFITILIFTLFIRAFTDRLFFQGYCEVFLFYFILLPDYYKYAQNNMVTIKNSRKSNSFNKTHRVPENVTTISYDGKPSV